MNASSKGPIAARPLSHATARTVGSDSHLQFLNYAIDNNAAFDFAANSRGYTYGALLELYQPWWALRFGEMLEPTDPSGLKIDWNLSRARSENYEFEVHPNLIPKRSSVLRFSGFVSHGTMGSYSQAVSGYLSGKDPTPDVSAYIKPGQSSYGWGLNGEQEINDSLRLFGRLGWSQSSKEDFQFAEADGTAAVGADLGGKRWHRPKDRIGFATSINSLRGPHRTYLQLGGTSYLLGESRLNYSHEEVFEAYYNFHLLRGIFLAFDLQHIRNPGYNNSRGPVWVFGLRLHLEGDVHFN